MAICCMLLWQKYLLISLCQYLIAHVVIGQRFLLLACLLHELHTLYAWYNCATLFQRQYQMLNFYDIPILLILIFASVLYIGDSGKGWEKWYSYNWQEKVSTHFLLQKDVSVLPWQRSRDKFIVNFVVLIMILMIINIFSYVCLELSVI